MKKRYVDVPFGQIHVVEEGDEAAPPVVLLHQTPRSWDEFAEVLPVLGRTHRAIAIDLPGMGGSDAHPGGASIESFADGVIAAVDGLGVERFDLVGHHTGGVVAVEVAATAPQRVTRLVLSSTPLVDAAARERRRDRPTIDAADLDTNGRHLAELWRRRQAFYPTGRPDILTRFVRDALRMTDPEAGHRAVSAYVMEDRLGQVRAPTLLVGHADDPYAFPELEPLAAALGDVVIEREVLPGGMVPLEFTADRFATVVARFLTP